MLDPNWDAGVEKDIPLYTQIAHFLVQLNYPHRFLAQIISLERNLLGWDILSVYHHLKFLSTNH